jgi:hypothetical protein
MKETFTAKTHGLGNEAAFRENHAKNISVFISEQKTLTTFAAPGFWINDLAPIPHANPSRTVTET